jgi:hypothetical protein
MRKETEIRSEISRAMAYRERVNSETETCYALGIVDALTWVLKEIERIPYADEESEGASNKEKKGRRDQRTKRALG